MDIYIPFTYIIGWSKHKKFYYGSKYAQGCQPADLWESYFTSSEYVKDFRKENGEPDIIRIHRTFSDKDSCVAFEHKYLTKIDAKNHPLFLNKSNGAKDFGIINNESKQKTKETCLEIYGYENASQSPKIKEKIKATWLEKYGYEYAMQSPEIKEKRKETCLEIYGYEHSAQSPIVKEKKKETCLEIYGVAHVSQIIKPCEHCGELKGITHETQCKKNPNRKIAKNQGKVLPFFTIIETRKTYGKNNLSRWCPEFKEFY